MMPEAQNDRSLLITAGVTASLLGFPWAFLTNSLSLRFKGIRASGFKGLGMKGYYAFRSLGFMLSNS